jgi:hypothetical protein
MTQEEIDDNLLRRAKSLKLYGMVAHWDEIGETG